MYKMSRYLYLFIFKKKKEREPNDITSKQNFMTNLNERI